MEQLWDKIYNQALLAKMIHNKTAIIQLFCFIATTNEHTPGEVATFMKRDEAAVIYLSNLAKNRLQYDEQLKDLHNRVLTEIKEKNEQSKRA